MWDLSAFSLLDLAAIGYFVGVWIGYGYAVALRRGEHLSLSQFMNRQRRVWSEQMIARDNRVVDTTINASLQNGTAFFASTSLIALGSLLTLSRSGDDVLNLFSTLPFGTPTTRAVWEVKVAGLAIILIYAFFKFTWAYRLFNYGAILIGAIPPKGSIVRDDEMTRAAHRAAAMNIAGGSHFAKGQRAFLFALAYLGWFVSAPVLFVSSTVAVLVMWRRQFASEIRNELLRKESWDEDPR